MPCIIGMIMPIIITIISIGMMEVSVSPIPPLELPETRRTLSWLSTAEGLGIDQGSDVDTDVLTHTARP
jgi:hypothetical protein